MFDVRLHSIAFAAALAFTCTTLAQTQTTPAAQVSAGTFGASTGSGTYVFPYRVGIGAATPSADLHVLASGGAFQKIEASGSGNAGLQLINPARNWYLFN